MKTNSDASAQTAKELLNDLYALVADVEKMMGDSISERTGEAVTAMRQRFDAAQERLGELYTGARRKVIAGAHYADDTIRANPYQSLAIAAGVGLIVGVLLGRRGQ